MPEKELNKVLATKDSFVTPTGVVRVSIMLHSGTINRYFIAHNLYHPTNVLCLSY